MPTLKSVCDEVKDNLCKPPAQDFAAAGVVRNVQRAVDPEGTKELNSDQVTAVKAFLDVVAATAYQ